ncbi:MAG: hypothetical protein ACE5EI_04665 [Thermodesulfobacteriota bacterium]
MECYYLGEMEAYYDYEGMVTWACFHPESGTDMEHPTDCPVQYGGQCLFEGGPFKGPVDGDPQRSQKTS